MTPSRHADLSHLIARARDIDTLQRIERVVSHELTPDLRMALVRRVEAIKRDLT